MIKYNSNNINEWYDGSTLIHKTMYNGRTIYQRVQANTYHNRFTFERANGETGLSECSTATTFTDTDVYAIDASFDTVKSITIGECINEIGDRNTRTSSIGKFKVLQKVDMSHSNVTRINPFAFSPFWNTEPNVLTSVTFSSTLESIGDYAFQGCKALRILDFPSSLTSIGMRSFNECTSLIDVSSLSGTNITKISNDTFEGCTSLAKVELPSSCREIMFDGFNGCTALRTLDLKNVTTLGDRFVANCSNLSAITINEGTSTVPTQSFMNCTSLSSVSLPSTIITINTSAFYNCTSLSGITLPNGLLIIGNEVFNGYNSMSLSSVTIPSSVTTLGSKVFDSTLSYVVFEGTVPPSINSDTFDDSSTSQVTYSIYVPDEALEDYKSAINWTNYTDRIKPISELQQ